MSRGGGGGGGGNPTPLDRVEEVSKCGPTHVVCVSSVRKQVESRGSDYDRS